MNRFTAFVRKEYFHIIRDVRTLFILLAMPPMMILLFGYAITNEIRNVNIAIFDQSKDESTQKLKDKILAGDYFKLVKEISSYDEIEKVFRSGKVKQVIVFEPEFGKNLRQSNLANLQLIADASDPNIANTVINYTSSIIYAYQKEINENVAIPFTINTDVRMRYNEQLKSAYLFVPGLITVILMLVSAMMTSISITREKELGTMEALLVSPMKPLQIILSKMMPYLVLAVVDAIVILVVGNTVFGVPIRGSLILLAFEGILFITVALALGLLISTITDSQQIALMISLMGLMLPTMLLSGFIFPIENMPNWLQTITYAIPARWFNVIIKDIMLKGASLDVVWKETLILMGFAVLLISLSIKKFKIRL